MGHFFRTCGVLIVLSLPMSACELMLFPAPMSYTSYYTPYLRYEGALYAGCQASRLGPRGAQEISSCEEPSAVGTGEKLFEIATDGPGFASDEPMETLGERLALPPFLEPRRADIEAGLRPLVT